MQYYVKKHGGQVVNGIDKDLQVIVLVHSTDQIVSEVYEKVARNKVTVFDPWRTYPKADNVVYYGKYEQLKDIDNGTNKSSISNA